MTICILFLVAVTRHNLSPSQSHVLEQSHPLLPQLGAPLFLILPLAMGCHQSFYSSLRVHELLFQELPLASLQAHLLVCVRTYLGQTASTPVA